MTKQNCPICEGTGKIEKPKDTKYARIDLDKRAIAKRLKEEGYGLREIARIMGYKNPQSVKFLFEPLVDKT